MAIFGCSVKTCFSTSISGIQICLFPVGENVLYCNVKADIFN
jgi:hypothetical protein